MKRFRVRVETILEVEFPDSDAVTEKSAAYIAEKVGLCIDKDGQQRTVGRFFVRGHVEDAKSLSVTLLK